MSKSPDMSRAVISYALRRSKPVPVAGARVGTDTGLHLFRALEPLLGYLVSCPQESARSHNVVHQVIGEGLKSVYMNICF